jgi:hypothetical protein
MTHYLYIIGSDSPPYKVGVSKNPRNRLQTLQTGHPERLQIHYTVETRSRQPKLLETAVHRNIRQHNVNGEWFNMPLEQLKLELDYILIRYEDDPTLRTLLKNNMI